MTEHLTAPNAELERLIRQTPEGMMFWAGTCNDPSATCGGCQHFGFEIAIRNEAGNAVDSRKYPRSCVLYHKHAGRPGPGLSPEISACKYFQAKQP